MKRFLVYTLFCINLLSCNQVVNGLRRIAGTIESSTAVKKEKKRKEGLIKTYFSDGKIKTEINYVKGRKDGVAKEYYANGKVKLEVSYRNGIKDGPSAFYYKNGALYRETYYENGKIERIRKVYSNGKLIAEIPYKNGEVGKGLKEYYIGGELKTVYPKLVVKSVDNRAEDGSYILMLNFSEINRKDRFFVGNLLEEKYLHPALQPINVKDGIAKIVLEVPPHTQASQKINFVGVHYTTTGNPYVVSQPFDLVIK